MSTNKLTRQNTNVIFTYETLTAACDHLGIPQEDYIRILDYAKLSENKDYRVTTAGVETLSQRATEKLRVFMQSAQKIWKSLSAQVKYWRMKRLGIKVQSLLRTYLASRRQERVDKAITCLQGFLGLMGNIHLTLGLRRRAVVKIQTMYRMYRTRKMYKRLRKEKNLADAAIKIQASFRGTYVRQRTGPELAKQKMISSIKIMQASIRRLLCPKIMYWAAVKRLRETSAQTLKNFFRGLVFRRKLVEVRGLKFLAVRAKFIAFILSHAQVRISRHVRGFLCRKHHPYHVARLRVLHAQGREFRKRYVAATKIRNFWKCWVIRKQYLYVKRLTRALQIRLRTSLARRGYVGPRLPL